MKANHAYAKLGLKDRPVPVQLFIIKRLVDRLTDHPDLPAPLPGLAELRELLDCTLAVAAEQRVLRQLCQVKTTERNACLKKLLPMAQNMAGSVEAYAGHRPDKIQRAGLRLARPKSVRIGPLPAPQHLRAQPGRHVGSIELRWRRVRGSRTYLVERSANLAPGSWEECAAVIAAKCVVSSLEPGREVWFRVAAVGAAGHSPWQGPINARAA